MASRIFRGFVDDYSSSKFRSCNLKLTLVINVPFVQGHLNEYEIVIGITQSPPKEGAQSALFCNLSESGLDNYLCSKALKAPSFGGDCVIPITLPYLKKISVLGNHAW